MQQRQQNRLSMNKAVYDTLDEYPHDWQGIPAMVNAYQQLGDSIRGRDTAARTQSAPTSGVTTDKEFDAMDAISKVLVLAGNTSAYAMEIKDHDLLARLSYGRHYLLNLPDNEQYAVLNAMMGKIEENQANTADYNVTAAAVGAALEAVAKVGAALTKPRLAIDTHATATKSIPAYEADSRHALGKLDRLMANFKESNPTFYSKYKQARIIVDSGKRHEDGNGAGGNNPA